MILRGYVTLVCAKFLYGLVVSFVVNLQINVLVHILDDSLPNLFDLGLFNLLKIH